MAEKEPKKRSTGYILQVVALLLVGGLLGYQYQKQALKNPDVRFKVAHEALMHADDGTAFKLFSGLAEAGDGRAQYWLADMYEHGYGVKKDVGKALSWLDKSAKQGVVLAEARLGEIYLRGEEAVQDFAKARQWLQKAASRGNAQAERMLGQMEAHGLGGEKDIVRAYAWYQLAVLGGDGLAVAMRDALLKTMSPDQIKDGQALAETLSKDVAGAGAKSAKPTAKPGAAGEGKSK